MPNDSSPSIVGMFVAVETAFGFSAFLPSIFTIRHFGNQDGTTENIRIGYVMGTAWALAISALTSLLVRSYLPFLFTIPACAVMVGVYEWALRNPDESGEEMK